VENVFPIVQVGQS